MSDLVAETVAAVRPVSAEARAAARDRLDRMTKPRGALGRVEDLAVALAGIAGACPPPLPQPAAVAVFAGDHGVHAQGVTPWPQEVTAQMVANFLAGGAVVNAFARQVGASVTVVDVGVRAPLDAHPELRQRRVAAGTADMTAGPAMSRDEARRAVEVGIEVAGELVDEPGHRCLRHRRHGHREHDARSRPDLRLHRGGPGGRRPAGGPGSTTPRWPARPRSCAARWPGTT